MPGRRKKPRKGRSPTAATAAANEKKEGAQQKRSVSFESPEKPPSAKAVTGRGAKAPAVPDSPSKRAKSLASPSSKIEKLVEQRLSHREDDEDDEDNDDQVAKEDGDDDEEADGDDAGEEDEEDEHADGNSDEDEEDQGGGGASKAAQKGQSKKSSKDERQRRKAKHEHDKKVQQAHLRQEQRIHAQRRKAFLEKQAEIFRHFMKSSGKTDGLPPQLAAAAKAKAKKKSKKRMAEEEEDQEILAATLESSSGKGSMARDVVFQESPSFIKGGKMRHYQIEGLNWLVQLQANGINGILADEMGLGKTLQSISILGYMREVKKVSGPHIVIVPKSVIGNWMNELRQWCPQIRAFKYHGNKQERQEMNATVMRPGRKDDDREFDVCVTTYEMVLKNINNLKHFAWQYLIIDEAHRLKNENSQLSLALRELHTLNRLLLTGTPLQNNLHEMWALLNFLLPEVFGSANAFDEWFNLDTDDSKAKEKLIVQLQRLLRPFMLRRLKIDVAKQLLPKQRTHLYVGLTEMQREMYKSILQRELDIILGSVTGRRVRLCNILMQLRKVCGHPYLFEGVEDRSLDPMGEHLIENSAKLQLLDKLLKRLKERGSRVLIFSQMTRLLDILEDYCVIRNHEFCRIDGQTTGDLRDSQIDAYNAEGSTKFIFLLSTRAGGLGINLQTADTVILFDSDWNPQVDLQAEDRAHRIGQKKAGQRVPVDHISVS
eukprot:INCI13138.2.p1 GENE.INCI13138.2~~INCI13138.2.p1  ORF type:complete len:715 (-),score=177.22 INCI13138.2:1915-4059(-)